MITPQLSPDAARPELGFWVVETASLRDYPQQFRTFDIVRNCDNTVSIFTTNVDPAVRDGSLAAASRSYTIGTNQIFNNVIDPMPTSAYNAHLIKQLASEMNDTTAPTVQITSPTTEATIARNCSTLSLAGTASESKGVVSVTWANSKNGASGACGIDGTTWSVEKVSLAIGDNPITISASDDAGNTFVASITVTYIYTVPAAAWKGLAMVSLPIIPDQTDPKYAARFYGNNWCSFAANLNEYSVYPETLCWLQPAEDTLIRGFWARFVSAAIPYGIIPDQDKPVSVHLLPGWNLVGNPFISAVKWDTNAITVQEPGAAAISLKNARSVVSNYAWGWKQTSALSKGAYYLVYDSALKPSVNDRLQPWQGYWVTAVKECDLIIPAPIVARTRR